MKSKHTIDSVIAALYFALQPILCIIGFSYGYHYLKMGNIDILHLFLVIITVLFAVYEFCQFPYIAPNFYASLEVFNNDLEIINRQSKIDITNTYEGIKDISLKGKIIFNNNIIFNSPSHHDVPLLKLGLDQLEIPEKKITVIFGKPESGKSELLQLIPRLYDIQQGEIFIDDYNLTDYNVKWLREQISFIESEPIIYNDTFENNIRIGKKDATKKEITEIAKKIGIHSYIKSFPDGYDYEIEDSSKVNNSIKQKIVIARALIRQPKILLIDKPTETLTNEEYKIILEKFIINELIKKFNNERTIIISTDHLFSSIENVDMIVFMKEGKILEKGNYDELIALKGEFYNMTLKKK